MKTKCKQLKVKVLEKGKALEKSNKIINEALSMKKSFIKNNDQLYERKREMSCEPDICFNDSQILDIHFPDKTHPIFHQEVTVPALNFNKRGQDLQFYNEES